MCNSVSPRTQAETHPSQQLKGPTTEEGTPDLVHAKHGLHPQVTPDAGDRKRDAGFPLPGKKPKSLQSVSRTVCRRRPQLVHTECRFVTLILKENALRLTPDSPPPPKKLEMSLLVKTGAFVSGFQKRTLLHLYLGERAGDGGGGGARLHKGKGRVEGEGWGGIGVTRELLREQSCPGPL